MIDGRWPPSVWCRASLLPAGDVSVHFVRNRLIALREAHLVQSKYCVRKWEGKQRHMLTSTIIESLRNWSYDTSERLT